MTWEMSHCVAILLQTQDHWTSRVATWPWARLEGVPLLERCPDMLALSVLPSPGVTPVDGAPHQLYTECYPVLLDGIMVGWVDKDLAPSVSASLRRFKVTLGLCELFCPLMLGFHPTVVMRYI